MTDIIVNVKCLNCDSIANLRFTEEDNNTKTYVESNLPEGWNYYILNIGQSWYLCPKHNKNVITYSKGDLLAELWNNPDDVYDT